MELKSVQFGVASKKDILQQSVVELNSTERFGDGTVYDERMGPLENQPCKTCFSPFLECPGHFGHINLIEPIPNPLFKDRILMFCYIFCNECFEPRIKNLNCKQKKNESVLSLLNSKCKKQLNCMNCEAPSCNFSFDNNNILLKNKKPVDVYEILHLFANIKSESLTLLGIKHAHSKPQDFILQVLPVLSHINRPFVSQGAQNCDDDLTSLYMEILKNNQKAKKYERGSENFQNYVSKISFSIGVLFNNANGNARHPSSGRKIKGLSERMTGKDGLFRNNCMGKRSDFTARAVASPGPHLPMDTISIPQYIANILTQKYLVTESNLEQVKKWIEQDNVDRIERIVDGERVEFAVKKFAFKSQTRLDPGDVIMRLGCLPIHVTTGREELRQDDVLIRDAKPIHFEVASKRLFKVQVGDHVSRFLQEGDLVLLNRQPTLHTGSLAAMKIVINQDFTIKTPLTITNRFNLDFDGDELNIHSFQSEEARQELKTQVLASNSIISPSSGKPYSVCVQDCILGLFLMTKKPQPFDLDLIDQKSVARILKIRKKLNISSCSIDTLVLISSCFPSKLIIDDENFQIICGVWICGLATKSNISKIINIVDYEFGHQEAAKMITRLNFVGTRWLSRRGFTIDANDVLPLDKETILTKTRQMLQEYDVRTTRDAIHGFAYEMSQDKNIINCIESGAKGTILNMGQLVGTIGQQLVRNKIFEATLSENRVMPYDLPDEELTCLEKATKYGYIVNCYASGMSADEFFKQAIPSRITIVCTATGTANSGYLQHRLVKIIDDVVYENNQVVYKSGFPKTISLNYNNGNNPFEPKKDVKYLEKLSLLI